MNEKLQLICTVLERYLIQPVKLRKMEKGFVKNYKKQTFFTFVRQASRNMCHKKIQNCKSNNHRLLTVTSLKRL